MKSVIISVILLLTVSTGVTVNAIYTCNSVDILIQKAEKMNFEDITKEDTESFNSLKSEWEKKKNILAYLHDYRKIENIELSMVRMESAISSNSTAEFNIYKSEFLYSLSRLEEISFFSFKNIL